MTPKRGHFTTPRSTRAREYIYRGTSFPPAADIGTPPDFGPPRFGTLGIRGIPRNPGVWGVGEPVEKRCNPGIHTDPRGGQRAQSRHHSGALAGCVLSVRGRCAKCSVTVSGSRDGVRRVPTHDLRSRERITIYGVEVPPLRGWLATLGRHSRRGFIRWRSAPPLTHRA